MYYIYCSEAAGADGLFGRQMYYIYCSEPAGADGVIVRAVPWFIA